MRDEQNSQEQSESTLLVSHSAGNEQLQDMVRERRLNRWIMANLEPGGVALKLLEVQQVSGDGDTDPAQRKGLQAWANVDCGDDQCGSAGSSSKPRSATRARSVGRGSRPTKTFGLNQVKEYRQYVVDGVVQDSPKYGAHGEALKDAARLGAKVVRLAGGRDLTWGSLSPHRRPTTTALLKQGTPVPVFGSDPTSSSVVEWYDRTTEMIDLFDLADDAGVELVFTFLTNGGAGGSTYQVNPATSYLNVGCSGEGLYFNHQWNGSAITKPLIGLSWSADHATEVDHEDPPNLFPITRTSYSTRCEWHLDTLDVSAPYKRSYVQYIGEVAASVLNRVETQRPDIDLESRVSGICLMNELSVLSQYKDASDNYDAESTGEFWGRACARGAYGLRRVLDADGVELRLPGVHSYSWAAQAGKGKTWEDKLSYLRSMVRYYVQELLLGLDIGEVQGNDLPKYVQGIDLHWYHHKKDDTCHIGFMVHEMEEVVEAVEEGLRAGMVRAVDENLIAPDAIDGIVSDVLDTFEVRASETGCSAVLAEVPAAFEARASSSELGAFLADMATRERSTLLPDSFSGQERFQAFEVWRRLGGALASRATVASWHTLMAGASADYKGFGLRVDVGDESTPASAALPRQSWFAFQRMAEQLGEVLEGRMVFPGTTSRGELETLVRTGHAARTSSVDPLVIFEYQLASSDYSWAYLVLADALAGASVQDSTVVVPRWTLGQPGSAVRVPVEPTSRFVRLGSDDELPIPSAIYPYPWAMRLGSALVVQPGDMPILIKSTAPIRWSQPSAAPSLEHTTAPPEMYGAARAEHLVAESEAARHLGPDLSLLQELWLNVPAWLDDPAVRLVAR